MSRVTLEDISLKKCCLAIRVSHLRDIYFEAIPEICVELPLLMTKYMKQMDNSTDSSELRAAKRLKYILENKRALIHDDNELIAGTTTTKAKGVVIYPQFMGLALWPELETLCSGEKRCYRISRTEIDKLNLEIFPYWMDRSVQEVCRKDYNNPFCLRTMEHLPFFLTTKAYGISHTVPDYEVVVREGLSSIIKKAEEKKLGLDNSETDSKKKDFYEATRIVLEAVITYAHNLSRQAAFLAERENDPYRKQELVKISKMCQRVPEERPTTFHEALQAIWICHVALHQENYNIGLSLGRLDQILYDLYQQDIENRIISIEDAIELICCLWLKLGDHLPMIPEIAQNVLGVIGPNQAITLGGIDSSGEDAVNDLTYVMLRAIELLEMRDPTVNARYYPGINPKEYLRRLCVVNLDTLVTPCFHNDIQVVKALLTQGYTLEDARDYSIVGCVGPICGGKTFGHTRAIIFNLISALWTSLCLPSSMISSFTDFLSVFEKLIVFIIDQSVELNNMLGKTHCKVHPLPLLSAFTQDTLRKGKDVLKGGATYNTSGVVVVGLPEVVDLLCFIKDFVFDKKEFKCCELIEAIKNMGRGHEMLIHNICLETKFGTNNKEAAVIADFLIDLLSTEYQKRENYRGGKYTVGYWSMASHTGLLLRALTGAERHPDAKIRYPRFTANLDSEKIANGFDLNLKYSPPDDRPQYVERYREEFIGVIEAYMQAGGLQVRFNLINTIVTNILTNILKGQGVPPDIFVSVFGNTAYFADLSPFMRRFLVSDADLSTSMQRVLVSNLQEFLDSYL